MTTALKLAVSSDPSGGDDVAVSEVTRPHFAATSSTAAVLFRAVAQL